MQLAINQVDYSLISEGASVSVCLATYNGAAFLRQQLDSLAAQTVLPFELVVGDDCSEDGTVDIVRAFAETAPFPVHVTVNETRLHFSENFIRTASRCRGRYIAFCDQDDIWSPHKLQRSVEALETAGADFAGHDGWLINPHGTRIGRHVHLREAGVFPPLTLAPWGVFFGFSVTIRRTLFESLPDAARGMDTINPCRALSHDRWAYFLGTTVGRTVYLSEPLVQYRQHGSNVFGARMVKASLAGAYVLMLTSTNSLEIHLDACRRRAALLAAVSSDSGALFHAAQAGAVYWQRLTIIYQRRLALAVGRSIVGRSHNLAWLIRSGAYRSFAKRGLGRRAFVKDVFATLVSRRFVDPGGSTLQRAAP